MAESIKAAVTEAAESLVSQDSVEEEKSVEEQVGTALEEKNEAQKVTEEDKEVSQSDEERKAGEEESGKSTETDERTVSGHKLYDALTGPNGQASLEELAAQFGRKLAPVGSAQAEEAVDNKADQITETFNKHLGEGYEFLSERMGAAIKEVLHNEVSPLFAQQKQASDTKIMQTSLESRMQKDNISGKNKDKIIAKANTLLKRMPPNYKNQNELIDYVGDIYVLASRSIKKSQDAARNATRITKNLHDEDAPSVDATTPRVRKRISNPKTSNMAGIREAVEAAAKGVRLED